ncbi:DUF3152 domain-containing protein [Streptomyces sp. NBC_01353]|uniref:DUF3152 domain-containing protein n=1 Tax=Streptomyces sp. NBC_01353 TaxID=2903835 RepID=UPI002E309AFC|nr:DUF3152 domain-containing protein [Streptomyces sp. NBC_01353]
MDTGQREAPGSGTGRRRREPGQDGYTPAAQGQQSPYGQSGHGRHGGAGPQQGAGQTGYAQGTYGQGPSTQGPSIQGARTQGGYGQGGYGQGAYGPGGGRPVWDTPMHGTPIYTAPGDTAVRGGHPEHTETPARPQRYTDLREAPRPTRDETAPQAPFIPGQRRESRPEELPEEQPAKTGGKGRTFTGIAAAAVTTVLAVVVAGQVAERDSGSPLAHSADGSADRAVEDGASRSDSRPTPTQAAPAAPSAPAPLPTYEQLMSRQFPIDPKLKGSGEFEAVAGFEKAPGKGRKIRYRVDVEKGLGLDAALFAQAVQKTLNDERSWAGQGEMTFERISSGDPEFVVTLASPGTTGVWCAKSDLDTTVDNVSCDSASTSRVMINAFRWAQGSETFGDKAMFAYRQMLINHEVGHRLGHSHVTCRTPGALAPVMQQQTKSLDIDGIKCRPNPWVHPGS